MISLLDDVTNDAFSPNQNRETTPSSLKSQGGYMSSVETDSINSNIGLSFLLI